MNLEEVTWCGLYCGLCASRRRIPHQAATLRREGYDRGYFDMPGLEAIFDPFWQGLNRLADTPCPGCPIRTCARERGMTACPLCADFPCERLEMLGQYPMLLGDGRRMQQVGLERWIAEQEARAATGFD